VAVSFFDSSALIKGYWQEVGSDVVRSLLATDSVCVSTLCGVELASALTRLSREGVMGAAEVTQLVADYGHDVREYLVVDLDDALLEAATKILLESTGPLRTLDAIQVAAARFALNRVERAGDEVRLVSADRRMLGAAAALGLPTLNPEEPDVSR
jgi:predicted nucleic acid-binding protein